MSLIKTSALNGIAVMVRMLALLGINKIMAIHIGPIGYALVGQFYSAIQLITTFASGAINVGVVRYTAENSADTNLQIKVWKTAGTIALSGSVLFSILIAIFNQELALFFLKDKSLGSVFLWFAGALTFFVLNSLLLAILNGRKEIKKYVIANIAGSLLSLGLTAWLGIQYKLQGALIALGIFQSVAFVVTLLLILNSPWFRFSYLFGKIDWAIAKNLANYTAMALTSAVCAPICHMLIRDYLGGSISWTAAGYWEALWKFSAAYMMLVTTTLSVYYLPRISELKTEDELRGEIWNCVKIILPFSILSAVLIYLLRDLIITTLFTSDFLAISELFLWQLIGDTLKILSWIFAYVLLGKGFSKSYILTEVIFTFTFYLLIRLLGPIYQLQGTAIAHAVNYLLYLGAVYLILKSKKLVR